MSLFFLLSVVIWFLPLSTYANSAPGLICMRHTQDEDCNADPMCYYLEEICGCGVPLCDVDVALVFDYPTTAQSWTKFVRLMKGVIKMLLGLGTNNKLSVYTARNAAGTSFEHVFTFADDPANFEFLNLPYRAPGVGIVQHSCAAISAAITDLNAEYDPLRPQKLSVLQFTDDEPGCLIDPTPPEHVSISGMYPFPQVYTSYTEQMAGLGYEKDASILHVSEVDHYRFDPGFIMDHSGPAFFSEMWCEGPVPTVAPTSSPTRGPTTLSPTDKPTDSPTDKPTKSPTDKPTMSPTEPPTDKPTMGPSTSQTADPTYKPTDSPTNKPTMKPTDSPTDKPTKSPTEPPTKPPSRRPFSSPTLHPTMYCVPDDVVEKSNCDRTCNEDEDEFDIVYNGREFDDVLIQTTFCYQVNIMTGNGFCGENRHKAHDLSHFSIRAHKCCVYNFINDIAQITLNGAVVSTSAYSVDNDNQSSFFVKYDVEIAKGTSNEMCYTFYGDIGENVQGKYCTKTRHCGCQTITTWETSDFTDNC